MENQQWPVKYEQSAAMGTDTTDDGLNNGNDTNTEASSKDDTEGGTDDTAPNDPGGELATPIISDKAKQLISIILEQMKALSNTEKYLLYLKLFQISNVVDPLRQPLNPLGSRSEINRTISWIKTHLEEDQETSLPKQQVYEEYSNYCIDNQIKSLSQADFGKVMKQVYPKVRARRLGTRGNSRYCYSGLRRCLKLKAPKLPDLADKPLSTEVPCTASTLTAAAWLIVKEWSELHFGCQFSSLQTLARFLVINHSVGRGTDAASQLTSASESQLKGDPFCGRKHREMQLQLQKKIQQKNEVKERKRKIQSPKSEQKPASNKKAKGVAVSATAGAVQRTELSPPLGLGAVGGGSESSISNGGSACTSPTQGKSICDKSLDFTQVPSLPDFKSFQKPACEQGGTNPGGGGGTAVPANKIPIPRLAGSASSIGRQQHQHLLHRSSSLPSPSKKGGCSGAATAKGAKYKVIQPKPEPCDITSYNSPQQQSSVVADIRSQDVHNVDRIKESGKNSDEQDCDVAPVFSLPRERLESISNVDKDAMDEYLGTNNSQHEEELSKYFSNNVTDSIDAEATDAKLSQLRQLLEQNGISDNKSLVLVSSEQASGSSSITTIDAAAAVCIDQLATVQNVVPVPYVAPTQRVSTVPVVMPALTTTRHQTILSGSARRRVSFENLPVQEADCSTAVPPSPNTRRKNFSFTPISPGPQSPIINGGRQSKCSSTNVSPFVSPRNTPVPRTKNNTHQNAGMMNGNGSVRKQQQFISNGKVIKCEQPDLSLDIPDPSTIKNYNMAMSAPASPMLTVNSNKSMLQKLLNASGKVPYSPDYNVCTTKQDFSDEIKELLENDQSAASDGTVSDNFSAEIYRSQSVPLHQMSAKFCDLTDSGQYLTGGQPTSDFADFDPIPETESVTVNRIIDALDEQQADVLYAADDTAGALPSFNLIVNNNLETPAFQDIAAYSPASGHVPAQRNLARSQSIDVNGCYEMKCHAGGGGGNPSRSVPSTPLPFLTKQMALKNFIVTTTSASSVSLQSSRSYPSTPLLVGDSSPFDYTLNSDCLLNGQPIRTNGVAPAVPQAVIPSNLAYFMPNLSEINDDNISDGGNHLDTQEDGFIVRSIPVDGNFVMVESDSALLDDNDVLISGGDHQSYNGN